MKWRSIIISIGLMSLNGRAQAGLPLISVDVLLNEIEQGSSILEPALSFRLDHRTELNSILQSEGRSIEGRSLLALQWGHPQMRRRILFIGCIHPDEWAACYTSLRLTQGMLTGRLKRQQKTAILMIPVINPDGLLRWISTPEGQNDPLARPYPTRKNARGIDLNRNFYSRKTHPRYQAEPETEFLLDQIARFRPTHIVTLHAARNELDLDYRGRRDLSGWLESIKNAARRPIEINDSPTYGSRGGKNWSLGHWAERQGGIPSLTFELPHPKSPKGRPAAVRRISRDFLPALRKALFLR